MNSDPIVIVSAARTAIGAFQGELKGFAAPELSARVPIILASRADAVMTRLASCAVAVLAANGRRASSSKAAG